MTDAPSAPVSPQPYRRFPGTGTHVFNRVRLYFGADHLLQVTTTGYSEIYRRFFFRDIQVISLHKTVTGTIWNLVWSALLFLFVSLAMTFGADAMPVMGTLIVVIAVPLGFNVARGPTCACYIQTAVQQQRLYSLNRVRRARRLIERLRPLVALAQPPAPPVASAPEVIAPLAENPVDPIPPTAASPGVGGTALDQ